jgi:hypothetical protein
MNLEFRQQGSYVWRAWLKNEYGDRDEWSFTLTGDETEAVYILDIVNFDLDLRLSGELLEGPFENAVRQTNEWFDKYILDEEE